MRSAIRTVARSGPRPLSAAPGAQVRARAARQDAQDHRAAVGLGVPRVQRAVQRLDVLPHLLGVGHPHRLVGALDQAGEQRHRRVVLVRAARAGGERLADVLADDKRRRVDGVGAAFGSVEPSVRDAEVAEGVRHRRAQHVDDLGGDEGARGLGAPLERRAHHDGVEVRLRADEELLELRHLRARGRGSHALCMHQIVIFNIRIRKKIPSNEPTIKLA